eukprot:SAG22_NODE_15607_length_345_cov_0.548780_2_plen_64_part_01
MSQLAALGGTPLASQMATLRNRLEDTTQIANVLRNQNTLVKNEKKEAALDLAAANEKLAACEVG